jgi:O-methyltransferase
MEGLPDCFTPLGWRYLFLLGKALRNTLHPEAADGDYSPAELRRARNAIRTVQAEFSEQLEAARHASPTFEVEETVLRTFLVKPQPRIIAKFLRANSRPAHTVLDEDGLLSMAFLISELVQQGVPGDLIECGVFRGGASIFMKGVLATLEVQDRTLWLADSFQGLPVPDGDNLRDAVVYAYLRELGAFAVTQYEVASNFATYELLDEKVRFLPGWFQDTLPSFEGRLALLRADGDWYESTRTVLESLYDKVSPGGFVIIDDYNPIFGAWDAVNEFRAERGIQAPMIQVNHGIHYWQKPV